MIHVFNRKELLTTYSMDEYTKAKEVLAQNQIAYIIDTKTLSSPSPLGGQRDHTLGIDLSRCMEYKIYVNKKDFDRAKLLLQP